MTDAPKKRDWYVTVYEYGVIWPIVIWGIAGIVYYFMTEPFGNDELIAAILLAVVAWYRFGPVPKKQDVSSDVDSPDETS